MPEPTSNPVSGTVPTATDSAATTVEQADLAPYDAVLLLSFGGPERPEDVVPFLENVTRGRGIPRERLAEVGEHYFLFGGRSPINDQCRELLAALRTELDGRGIDLPVFWGNRNWDPYVGEVAREMEAAGHRRVLVLTTSAYPSYSSCRQYRENLYDAFADTAITVEKIRHYADHPGFVTASVDATVAAVDGLVAELGAGVRPRLVFVTHSIPTAMAETAGPPPKSPAGGYVDWHRLVASAVTRRVADVRAIADDHDVVYCSRSGPPTQPWLEPDVNDHLTALSAAGERAVVAVPIGFVSDHMEVIFDLDTEAAETARQLGLPFARAATAGTHPAFVTALVDLLVERAAVARGEQVEQPVVAGGTVGRYACLSGCCPNLRQPDRPALCQVAGAL
ncbi:ferrochelatase [Microlunatus aurantiacus]|uniref:Coproporphyrin III ferrochelatase n=1 Tax=Microlunatus aurantiacus TaxID=446786 RepID=A0ABP7D668_9ACTN